MTAVAAAPVTRETLGELVDLPLELVDVGENIRQDPGDLEDLVASIQLVGVLQPIRAIGPGAGGRYRAVWGQRRILASRLAGRDTIPAIVELAADVNRPGSERSIEQLSENLVRKDLSAIEEAEALRAVLDDRPELTHDALADLLGRSRSWVSNALRLLNLDPEVKAQVQAEKISAAHAKVMVALPADRQRRLATRIINDKLSAHQVENEIRWAQTEADNEEAKRKRTERLLPKVVPALEAAKVPKDATLYVRGRYDIDDKPIVAAIRKAGWRKLTHDYLWDVPEKGECDCVAFTLTLDGRAPSAHRSCLDDRHRDRHHSARTLEVEAERLERIRLAAALASIIEGELAGVSTPVLRLLDYLIARSGGYWAQWADHAVDNGARSVATRLTDQYRLREVDVAGLLAELGVDVGEPDPPVGSKLPRGRCSVCGADVALRKSGVAREHGRYDPEQPGLLAERVCSGSGAAAIAESAEQKGRGQVLASRWVGDPAYPGRPDELIEIDEVDA